MIHAAIRLGVISVGSVMLIILALFLVRNMGLNQTFAPPPHPWFEKAYWEVLDPKEICAENGQIKSAPADDKILLTTRFKDGDWILDCPAQHIKVADLLQNSKHRDWIVRVIAVETIHLDQLVEIMGAHDRDKKFGVFSDSQRASRFLRKKAPQWLYASDAATLLRMQMFTSLWIETAMDFWPDFVLATEDVAKPSHLSPRLAKELERRSKRIIWDETTRAPRPEFPIQGVVIKR